ncbi:MAG: serine hydroxymethyltransferase [bacterium]|nr:serine hydroxymethyltransferase [bacterium]
MKDIQIKKLIEAEKNRQKKVINLIASENYVSKDVLEALGTELTNKYAEGYPAKRYYGGNEIIDEIEILCQTRALELFDLAEKSKGSQDRSQAGKWSVNVQALSGSPANVAVYLAVLPQGGKIMGMSLDHGGHLTHGHKVSITGKVWKQVPYGVDKNTEMINYEELMAKAIAEKPGVIVAGFTAYPRVVDFKKFREIADASGALLMVDMSHFAGLVAGKEYPSPFEYADIVTTTTHKTLRGPRSALIFTKKGVTIASGEKGEKKEISSLVDKAVFPGMQGGPHMNQIAGVAVALKEAKSADFKKYAKQVKKNAKVLAEELAKRGWRIISGGTDSHLILIDTWMEGKKNEKGAGAVAGKSASDKLEKAGIIVNKNAIPFDTRPPVDPSGIRLGTAAETTHVKKEKDFVKIAERIDKILKGE